MKSFEIVAERAPVEARVEFFLPVGKSPHRVEFAKLMSEPPGEFPPGKDNRIMCRPNFQWKRVGTLTLRELCGLQACDFNVVPQTHEFQRLALNELPHLLWTVSWSLSDLSKACASYLSRSLDMQISCALDRRRASRNGWLARRD